VWDVSGFFSRLWFQDEMGLGGGILLWKYRVLRSGCFDLVTEVSIVIVHSIREVKLSEAELSSRGIINISCVRSLFQTKCVDWLDLIGLLQVFWDPRVFKSISLGIYLDAYLLYTSCLPTCE